MSVKAKISQLFKSKKINILLIFVLLALLFSVLTKLSKDYTKTISFEILIKDVPSEYVILNDTNNKIRVTITTYGFNLLKYYFIKPTLKIDFNTLKKKSNLFIWTKNNQFQEIANRFNVDTKINAISPDTINFRYDTYFTKRIPVVLKKNIKFASGFSIKDKYILRPDSVDITGAKQVVNSILKIETETLLLNEINSDIEVSLDLKLPQTNEYLRYSDNKVIVNGQVTKFTEGSVFVPIMISNLPDNLSIKYFPKEIEVIFHTSLENYKNISSSSFKIQCDYGSLDNTKTRLIPNIIKLPDGVKNVRLETKSIEFIIQ